MLDYQKNIFFVSVPFFLTQYEFSGEQIVWDCNETTIDENSIKSLFIFYYTDVIRCRPHFTFPKLTEKLL
jgi:hypothetical protein